MQLLIELDAAIDGQPILDWIDAQLRFGRNGRDGPKMSGFGFFGARCLTESAWRKVCT